MFNYANARPNETALINYFEDIGVNWEDIAKSLLGWMSDDEVREWAEREGYDIFDDEEEEETEIRYFVCGLGYDTNGRITDYERSFGDFDDKDEAQDKFDEVNEIVNNIKERSKELKENFKNIQRRIGLYESWS